jgi:hypothetical protein
MNWVVYIIQQGKKPGSPIKIGVTCNIQRRVKHLQTANPYPLVLQGAIPCYSRIDAHNLEAYFHRCMHKKRMQGEWFRGDVPLQRIINDFDKKHPTQHKCLSWKELETDKAIIERQRKEINSLKRENEKLRQDMDDYLDSVLIS